MSTRRNYRSALREDRAGETRAKILDSARTLFADRGFARTTIDDVAAAAGVASPTVYAVFGGKGGMLRALLGDMEQRANLPSLVKQLETEDDARAELGKFLNFIRTFYAQGAPILRAAMVAANDADVASMVAEGEEKRRFAAQQLTNTWHNRDALRPGLTHKQAAETLWMLTSVEQFLFATGRLNWTPPRYERWLRELLERELFAR